MIELLAENNFGDTRTGSLAGPTGLVVIVLLAIGTVLLIRNMNMRLRRLPDHFPAPGEESSPTDAAPTGSTPTASTPTGSTSDGATPTTTDKD